MARMYRVGTGIGDVTDPAVGLPLVGMADQNQISTGVESPLYARAFVVQDAATDARVTIIIADIWAGTRRVKEAVIRRLAEKHGALFNDENVLLAGTHTHSGPGGFSGMLLYDYTNGGCDDAVVTCIVEGCVGAVEMANANLAPGRIYVNRGEVEDCGRNRSAPACLRNPEAEQDHRGASTDREMLLLKFVQVDSRGREWPVGCSTGMRSIRPIAVRRTRSCAATTKASPARCSSTRWRPTTARNRHLSPLSPTPTAATCQ